MRRDVLHASTTALPAPNLQLIAKGGEGSEEEICRLAGLILALVVQVSCFDLGRGTGADEVCQSDHRQQHVERIQSLDEWVQRELMWSIEQVRRSRNGERVELTGERQVMSKVGTKGEKDKEAAKELGAE